MLKLVSLIVQVDTDYCYVKGRRIMRGKKEEKKRENKKKGHTRLLIYDNKTRDVVVFWVTYI